jgi:hypothetical protein
MAIVALQHLYFANSATAAVATGRNSLSTQPNHRIEHGLFCLAWKRLSRVRNFDCEFAVFVHANIAYIALNNGLRGFASLLALVKKFSMNMSRSKHRPRIKAVTQASIIGGGPHM